jgi:hypothetical protein
MNLDPDPGRPKLLKKEKNKKVHVRIVVCWLVGTGRQLPPLSSVLYGIISRRRSVLAAQLLLREKSGA